MIRNHLIAIGMMLFATGVIGVTTESRGATLFDEYGMHPESRYSIRADVVADLRTDAGAVIIAVDVDASAAEKAPPALASQPAFHDARDGFTDVVLTARLAGCATALAEHFPMHLENAYLVSFNGEVDLYNADHERVLRLLAVPEDKVVFDDGSPEIHTSALGFTVPGGQQSLQQAIRTRAQRTIEQRAGRR